MKYSIIIPTLNEEKLLPKLLKILTADKIKNNFDYEIIISDGGSKDKTIEIGREFDASIVNNVGSELNISKGRNQGADSAKGDILIFFNADVIPEDFNKLMTTVEKKFIGSNYYAMTCNVEVFPSERKFVDLVFQTFYNNYFHALNVIGMGMGRGECHIISKKVFEEFNGYNETIIAGEDFDLFRRIRKKGKIFFARNLVVYESPRRYRKYGHFRILFTWLINSIYIVLGNSSKSTEWEAVR
ncbi:MAG: glycosyltransferase [Melioribacteraceae bacterium]|nr:glycosyltransferase [Melioribacteraceae bacterium]